MGKKSAGKSVVTRVEPATFWRRAVAFAIDWYVGALATSLPIASFATMQGRDMADQMISTYVAPYGLWAGIAGVTAGLLYYVAVPLILDGQTLGKRLLGVRIVSARDGSSVTPGALLLRQVVGVMLIEGAVVGTSTVVRGLIEVITGAPLSIVVLAASFVVTIVSVALCAFRPDRRALHDMLAGTIVVDA